MNDGFERFDMQKEPKKCNPFLKPVIFAGSLPAVLSHRTKIRKHGMKGVKPPYILLGNHNAFFDMNVSAIATFPHFANYIVAIDGYIGREGLLRSIGCICKRKFTDDLMVIRHIGTVLKQGGIVGLYPEARYSLCGTTAVLPESLGKLCKMMGVPVVTLMTKGHHVTHPFWNTRHDRHAKPTEADMRVLFTPEDLKALTPDEVNDRIVEAFQYDDFRWQLENRIPVRCKDRAEGLEKVLYQCPHCNTEFRMEAKGTVLRCTHCNKSWTMTEYGALEANEGETEFAHIPDWYEWERENVRREVEAGTYSSGVLPVHVDTLPNAKKYIRLGNGTMVHDMNGFTVRGTDVDGDPFEMVKPVPSLYSCHIEYEYLGKYGDCVDLNTLEDTWYVYPESGDFSITKMA
ncbi:MAG: hypothetical protein J6Z38_00725, partial [Lachnospiraceae bacterium]|nr:hypothetical protein [Lachnospiraceae bacterium]